MKPVSLAAVLISIGALGAYAQTPVVSSGGVANAANFATTVAPGSLVSIFGTDLAAGLAQSDTVPLSTKIGDVSVTFNGTAAPLQFVSSGQINAQLPWSIPTGGTANVVVTRNGKDSAAVSFPVAPIAPGVFTINSQALAINGDGSIAAPTGSIPGLATHPAKIGDSAGLVLLCTGLGAVTPAAVTGNSSLDALRTANEKPQVMIGGVQAQVVFAGLSPQFVGVNQINIGIPAGTPTGDKVPIQIVVGGITTANTVTIAVSQ